MKLAARSAKSGRSRPKNLALTVAAYAGIVLLAVLIGAGATGWYFYSKYARLADEKLAQGPFPKSSMLYSAPEMAGVGDLATPLQFAHRLRESGYQEDERKNLNGWYHLRPDAIEVFPGPESYPGSESSVIKFEKGKISSIISLDDNSPRTEYTLEPRLLSNLYDKNRGKRRFVKFEDIPPVMVEALISAEDKRFFQHSGFDPMRIAKAALVDVREGRNAEGASTLTMQLARMLWLDNRKTFGRKFAEFMITLHLEQKLSKKQIFEYYFNQYDLGRRDSFEILGFGEAAEAYFGKDVRELNLPEAATLAGLAQDPSYRNPVRWPERAKGRRNVVLKMMLDNGYINQSSYQAACASPMNIAKQGIGSADAPYFVDLVNAELADDFQDQNFQDSRSKIYTTIDPELQLDATEAVSEGMHEVDTLLEKRHKGTTPVEKPQVALICLDPHTGEVKALVGGRDYGASQLNHATAKRPSGSIFKAFVYAAALNTGLSSNPQPMTVSSLVDDEPHTFMYNGQAYEPTDYHKGEWEGPITLREAFAKSLNVPAVEVAEEAGYQNVADLAHQAGLADIQPTPAMALGAYDVTPMDMARAYTIFANNGVMVEPRLISKIIGSRGDKIWASELQTKQILDPRVNYLMISLMEDVLRSGTGAGVRARGFTLPAAGKTGTEYDAWFAGFTSKLLCIVWVGYDRYHDLKLEGAKAALPVWTDFMIRAHKHRPYRDVTDFAVPEGVVSALVDAESGELATSACPKVVTEYFLLGTQPVQTCHLHQGGATEIAGWETAPAVQPTNPAAYAPLPLPSANTQQTAPQPNQAQAQPEKDKQKSGFFERLKHIFH